MKSGEINETRVAHVLLLDLSIFKVHNKTQQEPLPSQSEGFHRSHFKIPSEGCIARVSPGNSPEGSLLIVSLVTDVVAAKATVCP